MLTKPRYQMALSFLPLLSLVVLLLSGCDNVAARNNNYTQIPHMTLIVGGKKEAEAELLTAMYTLLLRKGGFNVIEKPDMGGNDVVFQAITQGKIDLYPEFTTTGLGRLHLSPSHNAQQDYQNVKQGYKNRYHIIWLDPAPLNDTYGICTSKSIASIHNITNISQLSGIAPQLTIAIPPDGLADKNALPSVESVYSFHFNAINTFSIEGDTFQAVIKGQAQINMCYTTDPSIAVDNFVLLNDDKRAFPFYNPAPIVRADVLSKAPQIATILNPLAPRLTTDVSVMLQRQVAAGFPVADVAELWLKSQGLL
jgi:osmoprotectant transport system substrate-binding protein